MGHSDVQTTAIYLHLINQLDAQIVLAHEDEMDMLFATTGGEEWRWGIIDGPCQGLQGQGAWNRNRPSL
jgi:hypothetical protein